jgi:hypothetical protein
MPYNKSGFSLVESLLGSATLVIFFAAVTVMVQSTTKLVGESRAKQVAVTLAKARLEEARNMPYEDAGTVSGIPDGIIEPSETITVDNLDYLVTTQITYIDDDFDAVSPADEFPTDYKRVRLEVTWGGLFPSITPLVMWTDISPGGLESDVGGGTINIQVYNGNGQPVESASVTIDAPDLVPAIHIDTVTDSEGFVSLPGAPECISCYRVVATQTGYTSDRTYGTNEVANPTKPHLTVLEGEVTQVSLAIDIPASVTFKTVRDASQGYVPFQGVQVRVHGSKEIGRTAADVPVYLYDKNVTTASGGQKTVNDLIWDTYYTKVPGGSSVDFAGSWPFTPYPVLPGSSMTLTVVVKAAADRTLLVRVLDHLQSPVASASVTLQNDAVSYIATQSTAILSYPDRSQTFFTNLPSTSAPFDITVNSFGFNPTYSTATISGDIIEQYLLTPN